MYGFFLSFARREVPSKSDITNMLRMFGPYHYIRVYREHIYIKIYMQITESTQHTAASTRSYGSNIAAINMCVAFTIFSLLYTRLKYIQTSYSLIRSHTHTPTYPHSTPFKHNTAKCLHTARYTDRRACTHTRSLTQTHSNKDQHTGTRVQWLMRNWGSIKS